MRPVCVHRLPNYAGPDRLLTPTHETDAGVDLYASEDVTLEPGARYAVPTGLALALPEGYEAQIRPRSGHALKHGLTVLNSPGTIDPAYRGEIKVIVQNTNPPLTLPTFDLLLDVLDGTKEPAQLAEQFDLDYASHRIFIPRGTRFAQMVFAKFERPEIEEVDSLTPTARGTGGFGSTGQ